MASKWKTHHFEPNCLININNCVDIFKPIWVQILVSFCSLLLISILSPSSIHKHIWYIDRWVLKCHSLCLVNGYSPCLDHIPHSLSTNRNGSWERHASVLPSLDLELNSMAQLGQISISHFPSYFDILLICWYNKKDRNGTVN